MDKSYDNEKKYAQKLDKNGYGPSLMSKHRICYFCGRGGDIVRHEVFFGKNRDNSKRYGTWCNLCVEHHQEVHNGSPLDIWLKREAQEAFELDDIIRTGSDHSLEDFMDIFGKNYR